MKLYYNCHSNKLLVLLVFVAYLMPFVAFKCLVDNMCLSKFKFLYHV